MRKKLQLVQEVFRSPRTAIECFGDADARGVWQYFTSRHPKLPLFRRKTFGAALRAIPMDPDKLMEGSKFTLMRRKVRKAQKAGFSFAKIEPSKHYDEIMAINLSSALRQGESMSDEYVDSTLVKKEMARSGDWFGVFSPGGALAAYTYVPVFGDACVFWKILGDAALLDEGIMYLLVHETMRQMSLRRRQVGYPLWVMYDMYIGGADGLREFKRRTGFAPHRVKWHWVNR